MNAMDFISEVGIPEAGAVAERAGTTYNYFYQIACGHRNASVMLAQRLVRASGFKLDLLPLMQSTPERQRA